MQIGSGYPLNERFQSSADIAERARAENFPVASRLLPPMVRRQLMAIYGFARLVDDVGDEAEGDRLAQLDWLDHELELASSGKATHPVTRRLSPVIEETGCGIEPFRDLIDANRLDQAVHRYETFDQLVAYCMLSAAPVGRLVLAVFGVCTPERVALSDRVCIGLQVVEHLQDLGEDARSGRVYLPSEDMAQYGCREGDLLASSAGAELRRLVAMEAGRARTYLAAGGPLGRSLALRPRLAVCGFTAGGLAAIDAMRQAQYDVLGCECRPRRRRVLTRAVAVLGGAVGPESRP